MKTTSLFCLEKNKLFDNIILTQNHAWHITQSDWNTYIVQYKQQLRNYTILSFQDPLLCTSTGAVLGGEEMPFPLLQLPAWELLKITNLMIFSLYCSVMPAGDAPAECAPVHGVGELPLPLLQLPAGGLLPLLHQVVQGQHGVLPLHSLRYTHLLSHLSLPYLIIRSFLSYTCTFAVYLCTQLISPLILFFQISDY